MAGTLRATTTADTAHGAPMATAMEPMATAPASSAASARPRFFASATNCASASGAATASGMSSRGPPNIAAAMSAASAALP